MWEIESQVSHISESVRKILKCNCYMQNADTMKIQKKTCQNGSYQENPENKVNIKKEVPRKSSIRTRL